MLHDAQIGLYGFIDIGSFDFNRHHRAIKQHRFVDLGNGSTAYWCGLYAAENLVYRPLQIRADEGRDVGLSDGAHIVLQALKFFYPLRAENVDTGRQDLTKFDESRPQLFKRHAKALWDT